MLRKLKDAESSLELIGSKHPVHLIDDVRGYIETSRILGDLASPDGVAMSLLHGRGSGQVDAIGPYQPGVDAPSSIDYRATYASSKPQAKKTLSVGSPSKLHVIIDAPERTKLLEGKQSYEYVGNYVLALTARIGEVIGDAELRVYHTASESEDGIVFEGDADDAYSAFNFHNEKDHKDTNPKSLGDLLLSATSTIDKDSEAAIIVSDFMDGYNPETDSFEWEKYFTQLAQNQEDLMWINRVKSLSHKRLAYGASEGLDFSTIDAINRTYKVHAEAKNERLKSVFEGTLSRIVDVDMHSTNPEKSIIGLLVGEERN